MRSIFDGGIGKYLCTIAGVALGIWFLLMGIANFDKIVNFITNLF